MWDSTFIAAVLGDLLWEMEGVTPAGVLGLTLAGYCDLQFQYSPALSGRVLSWGPHQLSRDGFSWAEAHDMAGLGTWS